MSLVQDAEADATKEADPETLVGGSADPSGTLPPCAEWRPHEPLIAVSKSSVDQMVAGLVDIVSAEGPMLAERAFHLYHRAAGGHRLGTDIEEALGKALSRASRTSQIAYVKDSRRGQAQRTLYIPGTPCVVPRALGTRMLEEVPPSEIVEIAALFPADLPSTARARSVLNALGVRRVTEPSIRHVRQCLRHRFEC